MTSTVIGVMQLMASPKENMTAKEELAFRFSVDRESATLIRPTINVGFVRIAAVRLQSN
jgi:hypothetical protein